MILGSGGTTGYHFLWRTSVHPFGDPAQAIQFLGRFKNDAAAMAELRKLVGMRDALTGDSSRISDDWILERTATLLISGELVLGHMWHEPMELPKGQAAQASAPAPSPGPSSTPQQEEETPVFTSNHDGETQANALEEAAQNGTPFCEECARAKARAEGQGGEGGQ